MAKFDLGTLIFIIFMVVSVICMVNMLTEIIGPHLRMYKKLNQQKNYSTTDKECDNG